MPVSTQTLGVRSTGNEYRWHLSRGASPRPQGTIAKRLEDWTDIQHLD